MWSAGSGPICPGRSVPSPWCGRLGDHDPVTAATLSGPSLNTPEPALPTGGSVDRQWRADHSSSRRSRSESCTSRCQPAG
ncbi:MAG: hypothetical protein EBZ24_03360 [Synechococcaceae bacterium WB9_4xB_025]|nr:hypothetical protein [Synechococcaceae bacterium WB9_4xB_025]